jgi:hypothetical protein
VDPGNAKGNGRQYGVSHRSPLSVTWIIERSPPSRHDPPGPLQRLNSSCWDQIARHSGYSGLARLKPGSAVTRAVPALAQRTFTIAKVADAPRSKLTIAARSEVSTSLRTDLALDALDMRLWARQRADQDVAGLTHHSGQGVQYRAIRYTERLAGAEAVASVGSKGDSYDNAMAEAFKSLFKAECMRNPAMRPKGGWKSVGDVEIAVAEYVDWFNHRRLHGELGLPPTEFEANYWASITPEHYPEAPVRAGAGPK